MTKTLAKSLHTVTVLRRLAVVLMVREDLTPQQALEEAVALLDLAHLEDTYGLVAQAKAQLLHNA